MTNGESSSSLANSTKEHSHAYGFLSSLLI